MRSIATVLAALVAIGLLPAGEARADEGDDARLLAERFAPIIRIADQDGPCDTNGESFAPMSASVVLDNEDVLLRQAGVADPVVTRAPSAADLFGRGEGFFLDFNGQSLTPGCTYEQDYDRYVGDAPAVVHAHVVSQRDRPGQLAVQYWLYWYYNDWNNKHESDWEFVQLLFDATDATDALGQSPVSVGYAQHEGGERSDWDGGALERVGDRPVVYPSRGSHASYFEPAVYLGRRGTEGFGCDTTAEDTVELDPVVELLPSSVDDATDDYAWIGFTGRWGERGSGPFNGPTGPNTKPQWERPIDWHDELRSASVKIPGGTEQNDTILSTFCTVVGIGSDLLRQFQVSPTQTVLLLVAAGFLVRWLAGRTDWSATPTTPLRRRRRVGQIFRSAIGAYVSSRGALLAIPALYLPLAALVAVVGWATTFTTAQALTGVLLAVMSWTATAIATAYWHFESEGHEQSIVVALQQVKRHWWQILSATLLSAGIVAVLALTLVGLPFALRQFVRYQFAIPVATTEDLGGRAALRRSSELVRDRWWRTAMPLLALATASLALNSLVQLLMLIALGGLPLWAFVAITFFVTGLFVPMVATAPALLYGDAFAAKSDDDERIATSSEPVPAP